jgi:acyl-coenzyme A thioesterase PaaI-like protein
MQALIDHIPYAGYLGIQVDRKGNELTTILPFKESLIGNITLPALHGGAIGAFLEITSVIQLLFDTSCERLGDESRMSGRKSGRKKKPNRWLSLTATIC